MKEMRRILALVLCFVMLVGILPVSAFATDPVPAETSVVETTEAPTNAVEDDEVADDTQDEVIVDDTQDGDAVEDVEDEEIVDDTQDDNTVPADNTIKAAPDANAGIALTSNEDYGVAPADNGPVVVIAGSDYQKKSTAPSDIVTDILDQIDNDYASVDGFLFGGDYTQSLNDADATASGKEELQGVVQGVYGTGMDEIYVQGNHDPDASTTNGTLSTSGENDPDSKAYGVFVIHEKDYMWTNNDQQAIKDTAAALDSYLDAKAEAGYNKPIFVLSHLPLHFSPRIAASYYGGDGKYAKYIYDVLDEAGDAGLNIIFLFGHNHSSTYDDYLGGGQIYLAEGKTISIAEEGSTSKYYTDTLSFTYMNYGYVGYIGGSAGTNLSMSVFEIADNEVTVKRYGTSGEVQLKATGKTTSGAPTADTSTVASGATITLTTPTVEEKVTVENSDKTVSVTSPGLTGLTVTKLFGTDSTSSYDAETYSAYASYDITPEGYTDGKSATVTITLDEADGFEASKKVVVIDATGTNEDQTVSIENGTVTFTTNHFSTYDVAQATETGDSGTTGGSGNVYVLDTDGVTTGEDYLIVSAGADGTAQALRNNNGSVSSAEVTISNGQIVTDAEDIVWTYDDNQYLSNDGQYLYLTNGSLSISSARAMDISSNSADGAYTVKRTDYSYYLSYDGGWEYSNSADDIYFFVRTSETGGSGSTGGGTVDTEGGDWITVTEPDLGTTTYTYTQATSITAGEKHVIVGYEDDVALIDDNGEFGSVADINISGSTMTSTTELTEWTFSGSSQGSVAHGSNYLYSSSNGYTFRIDGEDTLYFVDNGSTFQIKGSSRNNGYSFYYNGTDWATSGSGTRQYVRLFQLTKTEAGDDAAPGLFAKITGKLEYNVERGLTEEQVLALVKAEIKGYEYTGTAAPGDDVTGTEITENLEFVLDSSYDGAVAGEYAVTISYKGVKLGTAKVIVPEVAVEDCVFDKSGSVKVGASGKVRTGANITVKLADGTSYKVPITMNMLSKDGADVSTEEGGVIEGVTVTYTVQGETYTINDFVLTVREPSPYPEYPDEGAVKVNKTATGVQFQSTGVAQVEISASGIPMNQGVDVLLILDTSSSMKESGTLTSGTRISVLKECVNALIQDLKKERADGSVPDVDFSVVDFAGYLDYKTVNYIESEAKDTSTDKLGEVLLDWTNVQNVSDTWGSGLSAKSGTNYDHGLQMGYDQLSKKQEEDNGSRKQFVLFMSDGAPFQYNGVGSSEVGEGNAFEKWLLRTYTQEDVDALKSDNFNNPEFYYESDGSAQKNRIAEAIKGTGTYKIPSYTETDGEWTGELVEVPGLGATMYSVGYALKEDYNKNPTGLAGMKAILNTIASVSEETGKKLFYPVESKEDLEECFDDFAGEALMAATNARFVDQMGAQYDLQMGQILDLDEQPIGVENKIEILSYDIYTRADYLAGKCTLKQIGDRKGTSTVLETITFNADGTEAYSDKDSVGPNGEAITAGSNILIGGVIYANSFWYNNNTTAVKIEGVDIPTGVSSDGLTTGSSSMLPAETFYWKVGTIKTTELAMRYYVYLVGSTKGTCSPGSYPTNEYAFLYYNNYLNQPTGQPCQKPTVSPVMAWKSANVSYAFYLVNSKGEIIVNQTTGETGSFANKVAITSPVVYDEILLNNNETLDAITAAQVLPSYYTLYDYDADKNVGATYTVGVPSSGAGSWVITTVKNVATTYVENYDVTNPAAYSNAMSTSSATYDYTHTVVWFAVVYNIEAHPDTVVIDYGLPVDISVLGNDMFGENGKLVGVGANSDSLNVDGHDTALASGFGETYNADTNNTDMLSFGDVKIEGNEVRYTPKDMQMNSYDKFAYAVNYTGATNPGYYYDTVTVIPATTVYYEDSFLTYTASGTTWEKANGDNSDVVTQDEDRPGKYSLSTIDANNVYGYDSAYTGYSQFSLDNAMKVHVDANSYATATFDFWGSGFDVISLTSNKSGVLAAKVYDYDAYQTYLAGGESATKPATIKTGAVNTYYGYTYTNGKWVVTNTEDETALYQIPVLQAESLNYGHYTVEISAQYFAALDKTGNSGYDLYLDAIRIYDPAGIVTGGQINDTISDAYVADGEDWPEYIELRNNVIAAGTFDNGNTEANGLIFIDGQSGEVSMADYKSYGPNNELYLAAGQSVAFKLDLPETKVDTNDDGTVDTSIVSDVQIGLKLAAGDSVNYKIFNANTTTSAAATAKTLTTATDMYYSIKAIASGNIVITNANATDSDDILSVTNVKITYIQNPNTTEADYGIMPTSLFMDAEGAEVAVMSLRSAPAVEEEEVPETTVPETSVPETTVPEETEPETEETKPSKPGKPSKEDKPGKEDKPNKNDKPGKEDKDDKETKPGNDDKPAKNDRAEEVRNNLKKAAEKIRDVVSALLGKWFR